MKIILHWNKYIERYVITDTHGNQIFTVPDCLNINRLFRGVNKKYKCIFDIKSTRVKNEK